MGNSHTPRSQWLYPDQTARITAISHVVNGYINSEMRKQAYLYKVMNFAHTLMESKKKKIILLNNVLRFFTVLITQVTF